MIDIDSRHNLVGREAVVFEDKRHDVKFEFRCSTGTEKG